MEEIHRNHKEATWGWFGLLLGVAGRVSPSRGAADDARPASEPCGDAVEPAFAARLVRLIDF